MTAILQMQLTSTFFSNQSFFYIFIQMKYARQGPIDSNSTFVSFQFELINKIIIDVMHKTITTDFI